MCITHKSPFNLMSLTAFEPRRKNLSVPLQNQRRALAAADAEGGEADLEVAPLKFLEECQNKARAGGAHGMAEGDGAAVDVELGAVDLADGFVLVQMLLRELL